jgi:hypothetical protein
MPTDTTRLTAVTVIDPLPLICTPPPPGDTAVPWTGTSIMVRHRPDGTVAASCRGLLAVGKTEGEALRGLAALVKTAARAARQ